MKYSAIREFERGQDRTRFLDRYIIFAIIFIPSFIWRMGIILVFLASKMWRDSKIKNKKVENLAANPGYFYSYFPFEKKDFLKAWFLDDLDIVLYVIITFFVFKIIFKEENLQLIFMLAFLSLYLLFLGIFKPKKICEIFYNERKAPRSYKAYIFTSVIILVLGSIFFIALLLSFSGTNTPFVSAIITRSSIIWACIFSIISYGLFNLWALRDWTGIYKK